MTDWADEVVSEWERNWGPSSFGESHPLGAEKFATALRKAKADGMREAATLVDQWRGPSLLQLEGFRCADAVMLGNMADHIEKGEV